MEHAIGIDAPNPLGLPSWVCDWSRFRTTGWLSSHYNASNGHEHQFQSATDGTFIVEGTIVGVVSALGNLVDPHDVDDIAIKIEQWQHLAGINQAFDIRTVLRATFLDVIMSGQGEHRRLTSDDMAQIEEWWWQWITRMKRIPYPQENPDLWVIYCQFIGQMKRDRLFATDEGHLGVGPRTLCVGDRVFIVRGAKAPLVFRPLRDYSVGTSSSSLCRDYSYVERCYLQGWMDGEAVTPETTWQTLKLH